MKRKKNIRAISMPTTSELEKELNKEKYKFRYKKLFKNTIYVLVIVIAISSLAATFLFKVLQIYGKSMIPTFNEKDIIITINTSKIENGDIIAFYYNNKILVKRVIATSLQWVDIDSDGNVYVNDKLLDEPYVKEKYYGEVDIEFPYQVPESSYFVLGDQRQTSIDSRSSIIGSISEEEIVGKVIFKVWPIRNLKIF